ncbi:MAG: hypothetical protein LIR50_18005 [Bacillota bacterium]|nr:hypothetical protein [Bacillota bacterium]
MATREDIESIIKDIDWSTINIEALWNDPDMSNIMDQYDEIINNTNNSAATKTTQIIAIVNKIKAIIYDKSTLYIKDTNTIQPRTVSICIPKNTQRYDIENNLGLNIDNHMTINDNTLKIYKIFEYDPNGDTLDIEDIMSSDIILMNNMYNVLSDSDIDYIKNNLNNKILFLGNITNESSLINLPIPFKNSIEDTEVSNYENIGIDYNLYINKNAKQYIFMYDNNNPILAYEYYNKGFIMQWNGKPYISANFDTNTLDRVIYSIIISLVRYSSLNSKIDASSTNNTIIQEVLSSNQNFPDTKIYNNGITSIQLSKNGSPTVVSGNYIPGTSQAFNTTKELFNVLEQNKNDELFPKTTTYTNDKFTGELSLDHVDWLEDTIISNSIKKEISKSETIIALSENDLKNIIDKDYNSTDYTYTDNNNTIDTKLFLNNYSIVSSKLLTESVILQDYYYADSLYNYGENKLTDELPALPDHYIGNDNEYTINDVESISWNGPIEQISNNKDLTYKRQYNITYKKNVNTQYILKLNYAGTIVINSIKNGTYHGIAYYNGILTTGEVDTRTWQQEYIGYLDQDSLNSMEVSDYVEMSSNIFDDPYWDKLYYNKNGYEGWLTKSGSAYDIYASNKFDINGEDYGDWVDDISTITNDPLIKNINGEDYQLDYDGIEVKLDSGSITNGLSITLSDIIKQFDTEYDARIFMLNNPTLSSYQYEPDTSLTVYSTLKDQKQPEFNDVNNKWELTYSRVASKEIVDTRKYVYRAIYKYKSTYTALWRQNYKGIVTKIILTQSITDINDSSIKNYDVTNKQVIMSTAKRHCIRIENLLPKYIEYNKTSTLQSINIIEYIQNKLTNNISIPISIYAFAFYDNENIPSYYDNADNIITYKVVINGKEYPIVPINSNKNGIKIIRNTDITSDSDYVKYINEDIKSLYLIINMTLSNEQQSPFISNMKLLIKSSLDQNTNLQLSTSNSIINNIDSILVNIVINKIVSNNITLAIQELNNSIKNYLSILTPGSDINFIQIKNIIDNNNYIQSYEEFLLNGDNKNITTNNDSNIILNNINYTE